MKGLIAIDEILKIQHIQHEKKKQIDNIYSYPYKKVGNRTVTMTKEERDQKVQRINEMSNRFMSKQYDQINEKRINEGKKPLKNPYKKKGDIDE